MDYYEILADEEQRGFEKRATTYAKAHLRLREIDMRFKVVRARQGRHQRQVLWRMARREGESELDALVPTLKYFDELMHKKRRYA